MTAYPKEASAPDALRAFWNARMWKYLLRPTGEAPFAQAYKPFTYRRRGHALYERRLRLIL